MDNADMRRGHETVHKKWDANQAILSGDTMLLQAFECIEACEVDKVKDVFQTFLITTYEIGEGQQLDVEFETRNDVREEEYIEMIRLKTSVLLACAVKIGAILADAPKEDWDNLYKFGEQIGLAFQLQDDLLDVYGDPKVFGKNIGGDITSNKKTYMLINAINRANDAQRQELMKWIEAKDFDRNEKVAAVTKLYDEIGIRQLCEQKMEECYQLALQYLAKVEVSEERKAELKAYAAEMMTRQS
jgi:geranylgeranyl diphosphate synthase type II